MKLNDYAKGNRLKLPLIREAIQDPRGVPLHECRYLDEHLPCSSEWAMLYLNWPSMPTQVFVAHRCDVPLAAPLTAEP